MELLPSVSSSDATLYLAITGDLFPCSFVLVLIVQVARARATAISTV